jgi:hypothetical protein
MGQNCSTRLRRLFKSKEEVHQSVDMELRLMYSKHDHSKKGVLTRDECESLVLDVFQYLKKRNWLCIVF